MRRVETRSGRNSRFTKTSQLQKVSYLDATPDMFPGFDPQPTAERNAGTDAAFADRFKVMAKKMFDFCEELEAGGILTCVRAIGGKPWNFRGMDVPYHMAFGFFCVTTLLYPQLGSTVLRNCEAFPDFRLGSCEKLKFTQNKIKGRYFVAKSPVSQASWELHHLLGRCKFWHKDDPELHYHPFPQVIDLYGDRGLELEKNHHTLMIEYFASTSFYNFHGLMRTEYPGMDAVIDLYALRYVYIYAFWAAVFARFSFEHRDFHGDNVLLDLTQVKANFGELNRIGLNHIYAIDLDTFKYPSGMEKLHPGLQATLDSGGDQTRLADSLMVGCLVRVCFEESKDTAAFEDWEEKSKELCLGEDRVCDTGEQIKALDFALNYLWNYNIKYNKNALSELYPPSEVKKFGCGC